VVEGGTIMRVTQIHARALPHCLQSLEDLDAVCIVLVSHGFDPFFEGSLREPSAYHYNRVLVGFFNPPNGDPQNREKMVIFDRFQA